MNRCEILIRFQGTYVHGQRQVQFFQLFVCITQESIDRKKNMTIQELKSEQRTYTFQTELVFYFVLY
jgi:hypothetical protein